MIETPPPDPDTFAPTVPGFLEAYAISAQDAPEIEKIATTKLIAGRRTAGDSYHARASKRNDIDPGLQVMADELMKFEADTGDISKTETWYPTPQTPPQLQDAQSMIEARVAPVADALCPHDDPLCEGPDAGILRHICALCEQVRSSGPDPGPTSEPSPYNERNSNNGYDHD